MFLHYLGKLKVNFLQIFSTYGRKCKQILIFWVFKIASLSPYWLQIKFSMSMFFYLFIFAINLWLQKLIKADVTAVFVNNRRGIQRWGLDFDKKVCIWRRTQHRGWQTNFLRKAGQSTVLISCWKSCEDTGIIERAINAHTTTGSLQTHPNFNKK